MWFLLKTIYFKVEQFHIHYDPQRMIYYSIELSGDVAEWSEHDKPMINFISVGRS